MHRGLRDAFGNGAEIVYKYDAADRATSIHHKDATGATLLKMDYTLYDGRNLIEQITETDAGGTVTNIVYGYDARRRLVSETRTIADPLQVVFDLEYQYDAGGNRTAKIDHVSDVTTTYTYDVSDPSAHGSMANRLMRSETRDVNNRVLGRVAYEYNTYDDAGGNVAQVMNMVPRFDNSDPTDPNFFNVLGFHLMYNKKGEVRVITARKWTYTEFQGQGNHDQSALTNLGIYEFRGDGRARRMLRPRDLVTLSPLPDEAVWTDYDGDLPTADYTVTDCGQPGGYVETDERSYSLGLAEVDYCTAGETCKDDAVTYTATDHLGTSRTHTDATAKLVAEPVYTAFGEPVSEDGYDTRYGYVGKHGYESLARLDWGQWDPDGSGSMENVVMPFLHLGVRWYDPSIGRFLQRDPIGVRGGTNAFVYARSMPVTRIDPTGRIDVLGFRFDSEWAGFFWEDIGRGAAATADGAIPIFDPFEDVLQVYDPRFDRGTGASQWGGWFAMQCVSAPSKVTYAKKLIEQLKGPATAAYVPIQWVNMQTPHPLQLWWN